MLTVLIAAALAEERGAVVPALRGAIDELLDQEREHARSELVERARGFELSIAKLEAAASALELALNVERGRVLDLPNHWIRTGDQPIDGRRALTLAAVIRAS